LKVYERVEEAMETIYRRRSIRKYSRDPVPEEDIREVIRAGMNAPSAGNQQPWQFIIIDDRSLLDRIPDIHPYAQMLREAPAAILVCGDLDLESHRGYWVQDCSAATENMLLEIADRGLGGVWLGVYPREDRVEGLRALFGIPEQVIPFALIALGHPAEKKGLKKEFHEKRIRKNHW
jgi:nitroreductase